MIKTDKQLAEESGKTAMDLRAERILAKEEIRTLQRKQAISLNKKGYTNSAIARILDIHEWNVRDLMVG